jgi:predicted RNA-binding Zn-ribbon protein involved in translation (DUF1610 family)
MKSARTDLTDAACPAGVEENPRMYCSTCGAQVPDGASRCTNCGAAVSRPAGFGVPTVVHQHQHQHSYQQPAVPAAAAGVCPRCGFQGPTVSYFSQGGHIAVLLVLAVLSWTVGGLIYYLLRRDYRSCARCGHTLGKYGELALASSSGGALASGAEADVTEEGWGIGRWGFGAIAFFLFAAFMMMIGVGEGEPAAFMMGLMSAGVGGFLVHRASSAREERRQALLVALQQPVLRLAGERGGRLTVTEVASTLGWPMRRAEKVLNALDDGLRVVSDVTNEGVIVYDFRELRHAQQQRFSAQEMDALLIPAAQPQPQRQMQAQPEPATQAEPLPPFPHDGTLRA